MEYRWVQSLVGPLERIHSTYSVGRKKPTDFWGPGRDQQENSRHPRPDHLWPELWKSMGKNAKLKASLASTSKWICASLSGDVNMCQWNWEWFFSRRVKFDSGFNVMAMNEASWHRPKIIRLSLHRQPEMSREVVEETLLILQESQCHSLLEVVDGVPRWTFSICVWKNKFSLFGKYHLFRIESFRLDFRCVHRLQLLNVCDQYVTLRNSLRVQCIPEEQSG